MKILSIAVLLALSPSIFAEEDKNQGSSTSTEHQHGNEESSSYICPMHPEIKSDKPGSCSICGMHLVPVEKEEAKESEKKNEKEEALFIRKASRRLAGIETEIVVSKPAFQTIKAVGSISFDEGRVSTITAYVDGRIEKLYANYTGVEVKKGEHLAEFYSPNLYSAQVEYLQAEKALGKMKSSKLPSMRNSQMQLLKGAEVKLQELGMAKEQIRTLKESKKANSRLTLNSTVTGTVIQKNAVEGTYVKTGQVIYKVADLSTVWLLLDLFPEETRYLKFGLKVHARIRSAPDKTFMGRISFIDPIVDSKTKTVRVRVEIPNKEDLLKPGDYADAEIQVAVDSKGKHAITYDPDLAGKYISPMHPQIIKSKEGPCSICGMKMVPASNYGYTDDKSKIENSITVPRDAVLSIGDKSVVFVEDSEDYFLLREIIAGELTSNNRIIVLSGLQEGDRVASSGAFLIDSQMQLSGKTSLMQVTTGKKSMMKSGHEHH